MSLHCQTSLGKELAEGCVGPGEAHPSSHFRGDHGGRGRRPCQAAQGPQEPTLAGKGFPGRRARIIKNSVPQDMRVPTDHCLLCLLGLPVSLSVPPLCGAAERLWPLCPAHRLCWNPIEGLAHIVLSSCLPQRCWAVVWLMFLQVFLDLGLPGTVTSFLQLGWTQGSRQAAGW